MFITGTIKKMLSENHEPVSYFLPVGDERIPICSLIGKKISIQYMNEIYCIGCGRKTSRSFAQGYCYPCLLNSPETDKCILHPEMCLAHEGISRDMEWSSKNCLQSHVVYLSDTTCIKVGVTKSPLTRWIDQGATRAIKLAITPNRYLAGCIEVFLKDHFVDKTNWRKMLTSKGDVLHDLVAEKKKAAEVLPDEYSRYVTSDDRVISITFPVKDYPVKVLPQSLDKTPVVDGFLIGIKAQYLIFDDGKVFNIRKHNGYKIRFSIS